MRVSGSIHINGQSKLLAIREKVAKYREKDVDLVVSIIGLHPNLAGIEQHLGKNPAKIAEIFQKSLGISDLKDGEVLPLFSQKGLKWRCNTKKLSPYKDAEFKASFKIYYDESFPESYVITMHAIYGEIQRLKAYSKEFYLKYLDDQAFEDNFDSKNVLGFAKVFLVQPPSETSPAILIAKNIQSALFCRSVGISKILRKRYKYWDRVLLMAIEDFAKFVKSPLLWVPTANHQLRKWKLDKLLTIHPMTAFNIYTQAPFKMGYALREIDPRVIESTECNLVWEKDLRV